LRGEKQKACETPATHVLHVADRCPVRNEK
jgi:hypothetical protein